MPKKQQSRAKTALTSLTPRACLDYADEQAARIKSLNAQLDALRKVCAAIVAHDSDLITQSEWFQFRGQLQVAMNTYVIYKKPDPFRKNGFALIVAGPEEYGIKLSAKQERWKRWKKDLPREAAFAMAEAHNKAEP